MSITKNSLVTLEYRLTSPEGELLNPEEELLTYLHGGYGQIFEKVEAALEGKEAGDSVHIALAPSEAFGEYDGALVVEESLHELPEELAVGMEIDGYLEEHPEDVIVYTVKEIRGEEAVLDGNHPLAGQSLVFDATIQEVQPLEEDAVREILEHHHHHHHEH